MKSKIFTQLINRHAVLLAIAVCLLAPVTTVMAEEAGDVMQGLRAWGNNCSRCHNIRDAGEFRDDQWGSIVLHMRIRAGLPGQMARDIRAYLQSSNFFPEEK